MTQEAAQLIDQLTKNTENIGVVLYNQGIVDGMINFRTILSGTPDLTVDIIFEVLNEFIRQNTPAEEATETKEYADVIGTSGEVITDNVELSYTKNNDDNLEGFETPEEFVKYPENTDEEAANDTTDEAVEDTISEE